MIPFLSLIFDFVYSSFVVAFTIINFPLRPAFAASQELFYSFFQFYWDIIDIQHYV